jgi:hypothetical protein
MRTEPAQESYISLKKTKNGQCTNKVLIITSYRRNFQTKLFAVTPLRNENSYSHHPDPQIYSLSVHPIFTGMKTNLMKENRRMFVQEGILTPFNEVKYS